MDPEPTLLHATLDGDDASREVYADWLEGNGDIDRAEFLRVQRELRGMTMIDPRYDWLLRRLHAHRMKIDPQWLAHVDVDPVVPFEVELAEKLAQQRAQPKPREPEPNFEELVKPAPPRSVFTRGEVYIDTTPPRWMAIGSTVAFAIIGAAVLLNLVS